jgi:hypothetical protein
VLPLSKSALAGKGICVYGPNANDQKNMMGGYVNQHPRFIRTIFEGLTDEAPLSNVILHTGEQRLAEASRG